MPEFFDKAYNGARDLLNVAGNKIREATNGAGNLIGSAGIAGREAYSTSGAKDMMSRAGDAVTGAYDTVKDKVSSNPTINGLLAKLKENPDVQRALMTALATGGLGAAATMIGGKREGETSGEKRSRILRNALFAAAAGGGGAYALQKGLPTLLNPIPVNAEDGTSKAVRETATAARNISSDVLTHPATMAAGGVVGLNAANPGILRGSKDRAYTAMNVLNDKALKNMPGSNSQKFVEKATGILADAGTDKAKAGLRSSQFKDLLGRGTDNFRGNDLNAIANSTGGSKMHEIARELINANGGGKTGVAVVQRMLNEAGAVHGSGLIQNSTRVLRGIADRSGLSDLLPGIRGVGNRVQGAWDGVKDGVKAIPGASSKAWNALQRAGLVAGDVVKSPIDSTARGLTYLTDKVRDAGRYVKGQATNAWLNPSQFTRNAASSVRSTAGVAATGAASTARRAGSTIASAFKADADVAARLRADAKIFGGAARFGKGVAGAGLGALMPYITGKLLKPTVE